MGKKLLQCLAAVCDSVGRQVVAIFKVVRGAFCCSFWHCLLFTDVAEGEDAKERTVCSSAHHYARWEANPVCMSSCLGKLC